MVKSLRGGQIINKIKNNLYAKLNNIISQRSNKRKYFCSLGIPRSCGDDFDHDHWRRWQLRDGRRSRHLGRRDRGRTPGLYPGPHPSAAQRFAEEPAASHFQAGQNR